MEAIAAASAIVGLAIPVFKCAKDLRARIKLVSYPLHHLCMLGAFHVICRYWQVATEKVEFLALLAEYEKDIDLLESLYNEHKALLDQHHQIGRAHV